MASAKAHPNNVHSCEAKPVEFSKHIKSLSSALSSDDFLTLMDFYVLHAPVLKNSSKTENQFGQRSLRYYGWTDSSQMNKLERSLLSAASLPNFVMLRTDSITETLASMQMDEKGCVEHSRAVLQQTHSVRLLETGEIQVSANETRMECLFRHIRNSLAHNRTYIFPNEMIMLEDLDNDEKKTTAKILIPLEGLSKWRKVIMKEEI